MGIAYWFNSKSNTDMLYVESQRFKARNYAQAGIEKAKICMCNLLQHSKSYDMDKSALSDKDKRQEFEDGGYRITKIEPFRLNGKTYRNVPHLVKGKQIGNFDVWEITVEGYTKKIKTIVEIKHVIRVYRDYIVY